MNKTNANAFLGQEVTVKIDRPLGSRHPKHQFMYMLNYGFIPNTLSGDGEELDAYILGEFEPLETFVGICIAVLHRLNEDDDITIITPAIETIISENNIC